MIVMDFKYLAILTTIFSYVVSSNITLTTGRTNKLCLVFGVEGNRIVRNLPNEDLENMAAISEMSEYANYELNRRYRILHYRDGEITPEYLKNALKLISETNLTDDQHRKPFVMHHWTPDQAILFGGEKPIKVIAAADCPCSVLIITSHKDHLEGLMEFVLVNDPFHPHEIEGSPMNGVIIPYDLYVFSYKSFSFWRADDLEFIKIPISNVNSLETYEGEVKLVIVISNDLKYIHERAESEALNVKNEIRKKIVSAPICVVAQSDNRENAIHNNPEEVQGNILAFYGSDVKASTLLVEKNDTSDILKTKFKKWKKELLFFNSHQVIAFHFTVVNGTEPEDSEEIFSHTFPDIPLSTLRLLDESSLTGVDYQVETKFDFYTGPVYAIVGFRKFGGENPVTEVLSEEND
ncbi:hypothetical protein LOAG_06816 [Loa loa]|uniref:Uncharacterized protein n=2 Tax=Loa loa TaxID=7209 RepID=A0A1S0TX95_LOALO|nr:hypothetical protein LOAG_06816 [Loa loa]EFO21670.2 hypothetical protein LOAG_06816 [Loa loa]